MLLAFQTSDKLFSVEEFRKRLKDNPFVDILAEYARDINPQELDNDIKRFNALLIVKKLRKWRNNYVAHKAIKSGLSDFQILAHNAISELEISTFLDECHILINKYMGLFKATTWSKGIIGNDDFKGLLKFASIGINKYEDEIKKEIEKYNK
jgi:hypothetical protein